MIEENQVKNNQQREKLTDKKEINKANCGFLFIKKEIK